MPGETAESIRRVRKFHYVIILEGIVVGLAAGFVVSFLRLALQYGEVFRNAVIERAAGGGAPLFLAIALLAAAYAAAFLALKAEPMCGGSGIPQIKGEMLGAMSQNWLRVLICKIVGCIAAIGAGLSLGREGPSIQIGAMTGKGFSKLTNRLATEEKVLMSCGAGAGLSCAFGAPLAGVIFTLEELQKNFSTEILVSSMGASIASNAVATEIFGMKPVFDLHIASRLPLRAYWEVLVLGIVLGAFGVFYNRVMDWTQNLYEKIPSVAVRLAIPFLTVIPLAIWYPNALGSGSALVGETAQGEFLLQQLLVLLVLKFCFSMMSFSSGSPGGIFLPLLVMGGVTGGLLCLLFDVFTGVSAQNLENFVILGMVGAFSSIVRAPVTGVILITEMAGDFKSFLALCIVALISYITADILGGVPVYDQLLDRRLRAIRKSESSAAERAVAKSAVADGENRKIVRAFDVYVGSLMDGATIEMMELPKGCLVVSVVRHEREVVPYGGTVLRGGDKIYVVCDERDLVRLTERIDEICRTVVRREPFDPENGNAGE